MPDLKGRTLQGCAGIYIPTASWQHRQEAAIALDIPCIAADGLREMDMGDWKKLESITQGKYERVSGLMPTGVMSYTPHGEMLQ